MIHNMVENNVCTDLWEGGPRLFFSRRPQQIAVWLEAKNSRLADSSKRAIVDMLLQNFFDGKDKAKTTSNWGAQK